ncbi:MAG: glucose 1-dehydrogenase, partial [Deltaproteobacteria bacterium]|nr:glucose 1-dehydrogenase [Deltaproteobacteria bacterium]
MRLDNRVAVVTGAGRNVGEGIARAFVEEGAQVGVVDIDEARAKAVVDSINGSRPGSALALQCDVTSSAQVESMVSQVVQKWGPVNLLVNNVGVVDRKNVLELDESDWDRIIAISLKSVFLCTKYVAKVMVAAGKGGKIINIASTSGHRGRTDATAYPSAKGGVLNLTRSLAMQLAPYNIRVNSITPNRVRTEVGPGEKPRNWTVTNLVGRQCTPQDVARTAVFLASEDADMITGTDILVE